MNGMVVPGKSGDCPAVRCRLLPPSLAMGAEALPVGILHLPDESLLLFLRHGSLATHEDVNRFLALERAVQQERYSLHLIEQPMLGCCCCAVPVWATCSIASNNSRRAFGAGLEGVAASIRPRYCKRRLASKPKKSGVHTAP